MGFEGNSVCPIIEGEQELRSLKLHTDLAWRWIQLAIMLAFSFCIVLLNLVAAAKVNNATKLVSLLPSSLQIPNLPYGVQIEQYPQNAIKL
jgi:hypothetical protein